MEGCIRDVVVIVSPVTTVRSNGPVELRDRWCRGRWPCECRGGVERFRENSRPNPGTSFCKPYLNPLAELKIGPDFLNIAYPATGCQKIFEVEDDKKLRIFYEKRMAQEVEADPLGPEWKVSGFIKLYRF